MSDSRYSESAFETVIELHLMANGYVSVAAGGFDRDRAIFPDTVLAFIRETQPKEWERLQALHDDQMGDQVLSDLCKWLETNGSPAPVIAHNTISLIRERRSAFITASMTGEIDVQGGVARNAQAK